MDKQNTMMWKEIVEQPEVVKIILQNSWAIQNLAEEIRTFCPTAICFVARGSSEHACNFAKYVFEIFCGIPVICGAPSVLTAYKGKLDLSRAVTIAVTQCGEGRDILQVVRHANSCGGLSVGVTNVSTSPVAREVKLNIDCMAGAEKSVAATKSFMAQLTILTMLAAYLSRDEKLLGDINRLEEALKAGLDANQKIEKLAMHLVKADSIFILGRGYGYGIATEAELKLQETCYIDAKAFAGSDYYHGPYALTKLRRPAIFLLTDDHTNVFMLELMDKMKRDGVDCYCVTNHLHYKEKTDSIVLPEFCEGVIGAFATSIVMQILACSISTMRGLDPDRPFGLGKVTITE